MALISAGPHYNAMRILMPKIFPVAADTTFSYSLWKGENNTVDSLRGHNAVWQGNERYDDGFIGRCFKFLVEDPTNLIIEPHNDFNFDPHGIFYYEFYFKKMAIGGNMTLFSMGDGEYGVSSYYDKANTMFIRNNYYQYQVYDVIWAVGGWNKVKVTYNDGRWELFLNDIKKTPRSYVDGLISGASGFIVGVTAELLLDELKIGVG